MTTFSNSPRLLKGAIVGIDLFSLQPSAIFFQYNPDQMTRTLQANASGLVVLLGNAGKKEEASTATTTIMEDPANVGAGLQLAAAVPRSTFPVCECTWRVEWSRDSAHQKHQGEGMQRKPRPQIVSRVGWWCEERRWQARVQYLMPGYLQLHRDEPWRRDQDPPARLLPYWEYSLAASCLSNAKNNSSAVDTSSSSETEWKVKPLTRRRISDAASRFSASARWSNVRRRCSTD